MRVEMNAPGCDGAAVGLHQKMLTEHLMRRTEATETLIQAADAGGEVADEVEVVGNEDEREIELRVEIVKKELEFFGPAAVDAGGGFVQ